MKRRIFAWVLLAGFVLLLLNLIIFRFYWQLSMVAYIIIAFSFLFTNGRMFQAQEPNERNGFDGRSGFDVPDKLEGSEEFDSDGDIGNGSDDSIIVDEDTLYEDTDRDYRDDDDTVETNKD